MTSLAIASPGFDAGRARPRLARCLPAVLALAWWVGRATMHPARSEPLPFAITADAPGADDRCAARAARDARLAGCLQAAAQGDAQAFEAFYDATIGFAHAFARRLLREGDIDDVVAEAYFQAWREAPRFDATKGSPVTWLLTRVHSRAIDLRRQQRHDAAPPPAGSGGDDELQQPSDLPGPEDLLALAEAGSRLYRALATLSPQERWVLGLAYFRELSHSATAQATGLPLGTVKSLLLRAQQKLRALMGVASETAGQG
ncbi:RNA polymerase sigma factor [Aquabacterium humicola]|uniref:RNA polymerase sigma factor n=1 Tax=Aquabacterium humicola TaxID=3237377 RepID=UPI0025426D67|nr:sigma-70 family RNA polymerase sigma factor [Rubrivivax pictus]